MLVDEFRKAFPVSIHAPAWGATIPAHFLSRILAVSIHAPAWGATDGCRIVLCYHPVSIHAPAWGATAYQGEPAMTTLFQSTRPRGARHDKGYDMLAGGMFQSTRPRGARRADYNYH